MSRLKEKIIEKIKSEGLINFEIFMEMALYYPGLGYYTRDSLEIGKGGDFYTSSHLHSIFGAMLGKQIEEMWIVMNKPPLFHIVEMGTGVGYLAKDMLEYLKKRSKDGLFQCLEYIIVELNPSLKAKQQELLSEFSNKVKWLSDINELKPITGCFLSNELLDAFPVRVIEMELELKEIYVSSDGNSLFEIKMPCSSEVREYLDEFVVKLPEGYRTEINLRAKDWLKNVSNKLLEGFVLTIDYGYTAQDYYSEDRNRGTLLCYYKHQINENPYQNIGQQDLTAHVNFSSLKKWGDEMGLKTIGFCPQGTYLVSLGIDEVIKDIYGDFPDFFELAKIKGLILPQGMGESHKVMIQYKGKKDMKLKGFQLRNQIKYL